VEERGSWITTLRSESASASNEAGGTGTRALSWTKANQPQSNGRKVGSSQVTGKSSAAVTPCGANSPVAAAAAVRLVSSPSTTSAPDRAPSSRSRANRAAPSPAGTNRRSQPQAASNAFSTTGPGPQSDAKLS